ncbi:MAG: hypothetical protein ACE5JU_12415 [Candidatus Binatia bacterium]
MLVSRVPGWLSKEGFSEMIREALGDTEARFFVPSGPEAREFVEYKDHALAPSEFWKEVDRFRSLDKGAPGAYKRFLLGSRGSQRAFGRWLTRFDVFGTPCPSMRV